MNDPRVGFALVLFLIIGGGGLALLAIKLGLWLDDRAAARRAAENRR
ncbi:MAG: hypothetical protein AAB074_08900 [Planctomycetota bacterium]